MISLFFIWIIKLITLFLCYGLCRFHRGDASFRCCYVSRSAGWPYADILRVLIVEEFAIPTDFEFVVDDSLELGHGFEGSF